MRKKVTRLKDEELNCIFFQIRQKLKVKQENKDITALG